VSPDALEEISGLFLSRAQQRQSRQWEEQDGQEAGSDKCRVDGGTDKVELDADLTGDDEKAERGRL
jgi:hypothetical protein